MAGAWIDPLEYPVYCQCAPRRRDRIAEMPTPNELYDQASYLRDQGDKEKAVATLVEAVAIDPNFAIAHGMLAKLYADLAIADKAIAHATKVVELEPDAIPPCRSSISGAAASQRPSMPRPWRIRNKWVLIDRSDAPRPAFFGDEHHEVLENTRCRALTHASSAAGIATKRTRG